MQEKEGQAQPDCGSTSIRGNCAGRQPRLSTLEEIVSDYLDRVSCICDEELALFRNLSWERAIEHAGMATDAVGRRFPHQRRLKRRALREATEALAQLNPEGINDFEGLIYEVRSLTRLVFGIGELYIYDTAVRLGQCLGVSPKKVYLHAGTKVGAAALELGQGRKTIDVRELPEPLQRLNPIQLEDVLCIYKAQLGSAMRPR